MDLFTAAEREEIQMYAAHYAAKNGHGSVSIQLNFAEGKLKVVNVNGRRFEREEKRGAQRVA